MKSPSIVVIIAAYNAEETITRALQSALNQPEVCEVIVVDDASTDSTYEIVETAAKADKKLKLVKQEKNQGPSAARNVAIHESTSPFIAILDADDFYLPNRFAPIMRETDWDFCADNIIFIHTPDQVSAHHQLAAKDAMSSLLTFEDFVHGNISNRNRLRGELGFLKPVMRRSFLEDMALTYNENCRLGEDYILYSQALLAKARYKVVNAVGYAAIVRKNSLSGAHKVEDLEALRNACGDTLDLTKFNGDARNAVKAYLMSLDRKIAHRKVLAKKQDKGLIHGIVSAASNPTAVVDIMRDRMSPKTPVLDTPRLLLSESHFAKYRK